MKEKQNAPGQVITFGLTDAQNTLVRACLPAKEYQLIETDCAVDIIAIGAVAYIISAEALTDEDREMILEYYEEINGCSDETVLWIGTPAPPKSLQKLIKCYDSFEMIADNLKYYLLSAHRQSKKARDYSKQLADGLLILSLIRKHPGIKTKEIAEKVELPIRTVQRYITALEQTGEWLAYDTQKKGWYLQYGVSILFGDPFNVEDI